jgi:signal transduction histidine kinase
VATNQLNTRLDNTMEITLFRMIQELVTNMVKHSKATEGYIYITHHFDTINLIVEDNGVGFDSALVGKDGMGLDSIAKRVGFLGGTFVVDSKKGKGSTIIIEIPLNI